MSSNWVNMIIIYWTEFVVHQKQYEDSVCEARDLSARLKGKTTSFSSISSQ